MSKYIQETTYGALTTSSAMSSFGVVDDVEPSVNMSPIRFNRIGLRDLSRKLQGKKEVEWKVKYYPTTGSFIFEGFTGTGSYTLELDYLKTQDLGSASQNLFLYSNGARPETVTIRGQVGEPTHVEVDFWSKNLASGSIASGSSYPTEVTPSVPYMWFDGNVVIAGTTINTVTAFTVSMKQNLERIYRLNDTELRLIPEKHRDLTGELTLTFQDFGQMANLLTFADVQLDIVLTSAAGSFTRSTSGSFYGVTFDRTSLPTKPKDLVMIRLPWIARSGSFTNIATQSF